MLVESERVCAGAGAVAHWLGPSVRSCEPAVRTVVCSRGFVFVFYLTFVHTRRCTSPIRTSTPLASGDSP